MTNFIEPLKKLIQENEFFRYIILLGAAALSILIIYYGGKETGTFAATCPSNGFMETVVYYKNAILFLTY